jgi:uncharacterized protein (TIGR04255 family)
MRLWASYVDVAKPAYASRVALRYINAIDFHTQGDLARLFTVPPQLPADAPAQKLFGFLVRTTSYDEQTKVFVHSTQASERVTSDESRTIVLDIDVYREADYKIPSDLTSMQTSFQCLREIKNATFFASITEETARRYE